ncbi:TetR/AcrR family transcriptional regulator [Haloechinothrix sp. LS1_15]|uniref:TetR/AcrR family transcriptional regulator n=1 Tax=Haloechinothrix sp. LS1_15 TaxID=2652248 RepID=UPI0029480CB1|nr:TetR/AcrR family transcriptional regulator [Haloechinothrix sp. LS1_15]MDV6010998.1 TetR/AcrR family transcriptional regulator [Haloechinothrix sp. LS1_15]
MRQTPPQPGWSDMGTEIRQTARTLLAENGTEGVTLRAIARDLGITAPALYRYYRSHSDLMEHLRRDICTELAGELAERIAEAGDAAGIGQFFAALRGFRRWALEHPREFTLVFASRRADTAAAATPLDHATEPFGQVFITSVWHVLAHHELTIPADEYVPEQLREDVGAFRAALLELLSSATDQEVDESRLTLGLSYLMVQFWTRIFGHVALEVSGNIPMPTADPDAWFDAMLTDIARTVGLDNA